MPAICIQCCLCEVDFILMYFVRLLLITSSFSTCFLLTTLGWIRAFVVNLVVSWLRVILGPYFGRSGSLLGPYSMKNWVPIWSLFQWSEVPKRIGCSATDHPPRLLGRCINLMIGLSDDQVFWWSSYLMIKLQGGFFTGRPLKVQVQVRVSRLVPPWNF